MFVGRHTAKADTVEWQNFCSDTHVSLSTAVPVFKDLSVVKGKEL